MIQLNMYSNGEHFVIASSVEEAVDIALDYELIAAKMPCDAPACNKEEYKLSWRVLPMEQLFTNENDDFSGKLTTKSVEDWIKLEGKCYFYFIPEE